MPATKLSSHLARFVASITLATFAAGCGGSDDVAGNNNGGLGTNFDVTLTGGSAGNYKGFSSAAASSGVFSVVLGTADGKFGLLITRFGVRPAVGSYAIGAPSTTGGFSASIAINNALNYVSSSGTLTITSSSASEVKGSFTFAAAVIGGSGAATSASGTFTAPCTAGC